MINERICLGFTSPFDATAVKLLREAGANIVGKANCDEFGMGYAMPEHLDALQLTCVTQFT